MNIRTNIWGSIWYFLREKFNDSLKENAYLTVKDSIYQPIWIYVSNRIQKVGNHHLKHLI